MWVKFWLPGLKGQNCKYNTKRGVEMSCKLHFFFLWWSSWRLGHMWKWRKSIALAVVGCCVCQDGVNNDRCSLWLMYTLIVFYLMCEQQKYSDVDVVTMLLRSVTRLCRLFCFLTDSPPVWRPEESMNPAVVRQTCWQTDRQTDKAAAGTSRATSRQDVATTINVVLDEKLRAVLYFYMDRVQCC